MITEDYVSFETAKLLKEKGFEYNPDESYWLIDANNTLYWISSIGAYDYVDVPTESFQRPKNGYRLVTQAMAMKWLREVHKINIEVCLGFDADSELGFFYNPVISDLKNMALAIETPEFDETEFTVYEEACEAAIKYCLEHLI